MNIIHRIVQTFLQPRPIIVQIILAVVTLSSIYYSWLLISGLFVNILSPYTYSSRDARFILAPIILIFISFIAVSLSWATVVFTLRRHRAARWFILAFFLFVSPVPGNGVSQTVVFIIIAVLLFIVPSVKQWFSAPQVSGNLTTLV